MENIAEKIAFYHNLFLVCLVCAGIFLVISVVLFIILDIGGGIGYLTGIQKAREIRKLKSGGEENKLSSEEKGWKPNFDIWRKKRKQAQNFSETESKNFIEPTTPMTGKSSNQVENTTLMGETSGLFQENGTTLLYQEENIFVIEEEILIVHTEEQI